MKFFLKCCNMSPRILGLTAALWPEASLSGRRAGCEPRTGRGGWGWGWAEWPRTGCSSGPPPGWAAGHLSSRCSSEPAVPPHLMFSVPASWLRATSFKTRGVHIFWSGSPWRKAQEEENKETTQWDLKRGQGSCGVAISQMSGRNIWAETYSAAPPCLSCLGERDEVKERSTVGLQKRSHFTEALGIFQISFHRDGKKSWLYVPE